jgi:membrane-bound inhibitor of C-type lysozyme
MQIFALDGMKTMKTIRFALPAALLALLGTACSTQAPFGANAVTSTATIHYLCESGIPARARYPGTDSAVIEYRGQIYRLQIAVSASGARYVGDGIEWWTKGTGKHSTVSVFEHAADGSSGRLVERCTAE